MPPSRICHPEPPLTRSDSIPSPSSSRSLPHEAKDPTPRFRAASRLLALTLALTLLLAACGGDDDGGSSGGTPTPSPISLPTQEFTIRTTSSEDVSFTAEIADVVDELRFGLMFRQDLPEDHGMLFVFMTDTMVGFWMQNTYVPLSVAFIDSTGKILDIQDMEPLDETLHDPPAPYRYALEMNQGWYADNGIEVGDTLLGPLPVAGGP